MQTGTSDNHGLSLAANLILGDGAEMLYNDLRFLRQIMRMQAQEFTQSLVRLTLFIARIIRNLLADLEVGIIGHIVFQDIQDKTFLNCLLHRVDVERTRNSVCIRRTKHFESLCLGCCGKCKEG